VRIEIKPSALAHLITKAEIRAVIDYPALRLPIAPRRTGAKPVLFIGPAADNEPWIEVIADLADADVAEVFHAMMLRPNLIESLGLAPFVHPEYAPQRARPGKESQ
jgi:hypothetical protein